MNLSSHFFLVLIIQTFSLAADDVMLVRNVGTLAFDDVTFVVIVFWFDGFRLKKNKFQCKFCGNKFMRSNVYKQHRMVHTGEEMHKCGLCLSEFL